MIAADAGVGTRVADNKRRAVLAVLAVGGACGLVVGLLSLLVVPAPWAAAVVFVVVAAVLAAAAWWGSEPLARRLLDARPADPVRHARLFNLVEALCVGAGVPQPGLCVVDEPGLNALSVGRSPRHASLVVTEGLLQHLSRVELESVLAHELSHVKSDDVVVSTVAVGLFGVLGGPVRAVTTGGSGAAVGYLFLPLGTLAGVGMQLVVGRQREELADLSGVAMTRYPPAMVTALEKMTRAGTLVRSARPATAHLWLASPLPPPPAGRLTSLARLFETHPPLDERIEALREL